MDATIPIGIIAIVLLLIAQYISGYRRSLETDINFFAFPFHFKGKALSPKEVQETQEEIELMKRVDFTTLMPMVQRKYAEQYKDKIKKHINKCGIPQSRIVDTLDISDIDCGESWSCIEYPTAFEQYDEKDHTTTIHTYAGTVVGRIGPSKYPRLVASGNGNTYLKRTEVAAFYHLTIAFNITESKISKIGDQIADLFKEGNVQVALEMMEEVKVLVGLGRGCYASKKELFKNAVIAKLTKENIGSRIFIHSESQPYRVITNLFSPMKLYTLDDFIEVARSELIKHQQSVGDWIFTSDKEVYREIIKRVEVTENVNISKCTEELFRLLNHDLKY